MTDQKHTGSPHTDKTFETAPDLAAAQKDAFYAPEGEGFDTVHVSPYVEGLPSLTVK